MVGAWEADHLDMQRHHLLMRTTEHARGTSSGPVSPFSALLEKNCGRTAEKIDLAL